MLNQAQQKFLIDAYAAAKAAGHIFPDVAACEAALESSWGFSSLARNANNLFGQKAPHGYTGPTLVLPTQEYAHGGWSSVIATWMKFADWTEAFRERMDLLRRLAPSYPNYASALAASDPESFITNVSKSWSTDPQRAAKVLEIYRAHKDLFAEVSA